MSALVYTDWLDDNLLSSAPINLKAHVTTHLIDKAGFVDEIIFNDSEAADTYQCYQISASPTTIGLKLTSDITTLPL